MSVPAGATRVDYNFTVYASGGEPLYTPFQSFQFHLEDIASPRCFAIAERLKRAISLPILHADQHGSATAVLAALLNALKVVDKKLESISVVINGAGAAGLSTAKMLKHIGVGDVKVLDVMAPCTTAGPKA